MSDSLLSTMDEIFEDYVAKGETEEKEEEIEEKEIVDDDVVDYYWRLVHALLKSFIDDDPSIMKILSYLLEKETSSNLPLDLVDKVMRKILLWLEKPSELLMTWLVNHLMSMNLIAESSSFLKSHSAKMYLARCDEDGKFEKNRYYVKKSDPNQQIITPLYKFV